MPTSQPMFHSFDDGHTWTRGRPPLAIERDFPGPIRYHVGDPPLPWPEGAGVVIERPEERFFHDPDQGRLPLHA